MESVVQSIHSGEFESMQANFIIIISLLQSTARRRPPPGYATRPVFIYFVTLKMKKNIQDDPGIFDNRKFVSHKMHTGAAVNAGANRATALGSRAHRVVLVTLV